MGEVVRAAQTFLPCVLVVDDGSTDASGAVAGRAGADVLQLKRNGGKGRALRAGWEMAARQGFKWVLMMDADGQHAAADIPAFLDRAEDSGAPLVVGNRMGNAAAMPWLRRRVNAWMSKRISRWVGAEVPDSQCGFRLARLDLLQRLPILANRFEIESAMLAAFYLYGCAVEFVPIQTIYRSRKSHICPLGDAWRWWRWRMAQRDNLRACMMMRVP